MKNIITLFVAIVMINIMALQAQKKETRNVSTFSKISYHIPGKLYLRQGGSQKVELEGTEETLAKIVTRIEGDRLIIEMENKWNDWHWGDDDKITAHVTVSDIRAIGVSGSGDLIAETKLSSQDLDLKVSGSGSLTADVDVKGILKADVSGSGGMELKGNCQQLKSNVSGSGRVTASATVTDNSDFSVSGSGKILASGTTKTVKATISGSGKVLAANLEAQRCEVRISGSGDVEINVKDEINATISGSGSVAYKGNPSKVNSHASGSGSVHKL